jgi:hypothetical protein
VAPFRPVCLFIARAPLSRLALCLLFLSGQLRLRRTAFSFVQGQAVGMIQNPGLWK